jgi:diguanylate cyclase (GGDEF)-like protein
MLLGLQNVILEMVARGRPLDETARRICLEAEALSANCFCTILTVDESGRLNSLAGPSVPQAYCDAITGLEIGPSVGCCGAAAYRRSPVAATDIATDPLWDDYRHLALPIGLLACWSSPIFGTAGEVIGTFAFYYSERRGPNAIETGIVETCVNLCAIALERHAVEARNHRLAYFDALTQLPNRASFDLASLEAEAAGSFGLLLVGVDRLKLVNDTLGHAGGDELLREVGRRIQACAPDGRAYRLGGDEFAILVPGPDPAERMQWVADAVADAMQAPITCWDRSVPTTVTVGGAAVGADGVTPGSLRQSADFALHHAKEKSRGGFVRFSAGLGAAMTRSYHAVRKVRDALDAGRVHARYQPVVRLDTADVVGVEALCWIMSPEGVRIDSEDFQLALADGDTASRLTERMLTMIAPDVRSWLDEGIPFQHVGVNVTTGDFQAGDLDERLASIFERHGVPLKHVILEVTEMVYMGESDLMVAEAIKALRARGLLVALDDFGTGYASLTHLLTFPVDVIKIDRSFVAALFPGAPSAAIVGGLIEIAEKLGMTVVAEGVETEQQAQQLRSLGCRLGQGYYYARPGDLEAVTRILRERAQKPDGAPKLSAKSAA